MLVSRAGYDQASAKMRAAGMSPTAIGVFQDYWSQVAAGATGLIAEDSIEPLTDPSLVDVTAATPDDRAALGRVAIIKLNGGLGTSMGLSRAKSLLTVTGGLTFLDLMVRQVLAARRRYDIRLPLIFLDSFNTRDDTLAALAAYPGLATPGLPADVMQSEEPKLLQTDLSPVSWPAEARLEWCPPGHGDLYPSLLDSGVLDQLLDQGFRYASVSNGDNLGAGPNPALAGWFARSGAPFAAEVTRRTAMDVKGGHLARRRSDGRLILRETAQTPVDELPYFTDAARHPYAHCNNLWFDLAALKAKLTATGGVLGLPLILNAKTVDPRDASSPAVYQIESAMGAAISAFDGAAAVAVPRSRFLPVKTTNELTLLRSDVFTLGDDYIPRATLDRLPVIELAKLYAKLADFDRRLPYPLSLVEARHLRVSGDWTFGRSVQVVGDVDLGPAGGVIADEAVLGTTGSAGPSPN